MSDIRNSPLQVRLPFLLALAVAGGMMVGATMFGGGSNEKNVFRAQSKFREVLMLVDRDYVDTVDSEALVEVAITKMLEKLDPHTVYIPTREVELANTQLEGNFDGIGIEFYIVQDTINVVTPITGGPSEAVGLQPGDKIVRVDGQNVAGTGITNRDVYEKLRGKKGSKVRLGVQRRDQPKLLEFTIVRDKIPSHSVDVGYMVDERTGYIKISRFAANTYEEFRQALRNLRDKGMQQLIVDVRDNPGGYLDRATKIADELLAGNKMIVYTDGRGERFDQKIYAYRPGSFEEGPVIVLVNEGSASASEILAGALQDNDRALIVGRRTFGKGLVQMPINLSDNSELRLTISRYYTPSGRSIQKPYEGEDAYDRDIIARYEHGEFFTADSIKLNDSLQYRTSKGRLVYGGGGIMPDHFVGADTTRGSKYLSALYGKNVMREYAMSYYNSHRKELEAQGLRRYVERFRVTESMLNELVARAEIAGIDFDSAQYARSRSTIENSLKAFIARSVWGNEGFYPVLHQQDGIFQRSRQLFGEAQALAAHNY